MKRGSISWDETLGLNALLVNKSFIFHAEALEMALLLPMHTVVFRICVYMYPHVQLHAVYVFIVLEYFILIFPHKYFHHRQAESCEPFSLHVSAHLSGHACCRHDDLWPLIDAVTSGRLPAFGSKTKKSVMLSSATICLFLFLFHSPCGLTLTPTFAHSLHTVCGKLARRSDRLLLLGRIHC